MNDFYASYVYMDWAVYNDLKTAVYGVSSSSSDFFSVYIKSIT